jgi:hypothetical protein
LASNVDVDLDVNVNLNPTVDVILDATVERLANERPNAKCASVIEI